MIVHVTPSYPPRLGGLEKVVQVLAGTQLKQGHEVRVITSDHGAEQNVIAEKFDVVRLKSFELANTTIIPSLFSTLRLLDRTDIVHLHITQAFTPEMVWLGAKIKHFSYVAHIHLDVPASGPVGFLLKIYKPLFLKRVLRNASYVVVFTNDQKETVSRQYAIQPDKIHVIPNGVEDKFYFKKRTKTSKQVKLLFVGRLNYQKNLPQLLHALNDVSALFKTRIVGDGELRKELEDLTKSLKLKHVTFTGRLDGTALLDEYRTADVFVLPSEREGMPLVLLEAMAMGLPIVATNVTGSRDVVNDNINGILVPYNDNVAFQSALTNLRDNTALYAKLSQNAYTVSKQYSWDKIARRFTKLYEEIS